MRPFVLHEAIDDHALDAIGGQIEWMAVQEHEVGVFSDFDAADTIVEHQRFRAAQRESLERVIFTQTVAYEKGAIFAEVAELFATLIGLDARDDPRFRELLYDVNRLLVTIILNDHHGAYDRDDAALCQ